jgi:alanyl-tRNA synthetase
MIPDKEIKKQFKIEASKSPDKFYATEVLKSEGFVRRQCKCGTFYWAINPDQKTCGDPSCSGGFRFIGSSPAKKQMDYVEVWQEFSRLFKKKGYTPIPRYPVVAKWRDDAYFVKASIYDFQPYVVSGEVEPPANPLVVPQLCLRFNDIDNIGITGAHYCCFDMIGQHTFVPESEWSQAQLFSDIHDWLKTGLGLPNEEITFHEDAWAGGGNFGPSMEFFSRGLELGNQVYTMFEQTPSGNKPLKMKVLDMGMGHERNAWFTKGTSTSYETTFPTVMKTLFAKTGIRYDKNLLQSFLPHSSWLNIDEVDDINKTWADVAKSIKVDADVLKRTILPLSRLYSVGEHSRALLVAFNDGALPSNVGDAYNLRILLRRMLSFIDQEGWDIDIHGLFEEHARYLKPIYPELLDNLENVKKIFDVEKQKYLATKEKSRAIVSKLITQGNITEDKLLQLYDSQGISPEFIKDESEKAGKKLSIPENFYVRVSELHEKFEQVHATSCKEKLSLENVPETAALYFDDYKKINFSAKVLKIIDKNVVMDKTLFYPTSGGQLHDIGTISGDEVVEVFKQGNVIVHVLKDKPNFKEGEIVVGNIDFDRRMQLSQHHTETHIINAAARKVLGNHINQAGAKKTVEKAHLDVTHYQSITDAELKEIEAEANKIVKMALPIKTSFLPRSEAEKRYGMGLYQGGAVPGKNIRIVEISGIDIEACGGTHLHNTSEVGEIKILKSAKIQDGIVRLTFIAGNALKSVSSGNGDIIGEAAKLLSVLPDEVPARAQELFTLWKNCRKADKKSIKLSEDNLTLKQKECFFGDTLCETAKVLQTQPEHIINTIKRFMKDIEDYKNK